VELKEAFATNRPLTRFRVSALALREAYNICLPNLHYINLA
jgi:hypothetical protein